MRIESEIGITVTILIIIILNIVVYIPQIDQYLLEIFTNMLIIFSVILSPIVFFWKRKYDKRTNRHNSGSSILEELKTIQDDLKGNGKNNLVKYTYHNKQKEIRFYSIYLGFTGFESSIHSGHCIIF